MPAAVYASVSDITAIGRTLTAAQSDAAGVLLEQASAKLRLTAKRYGKNIDAMIADPTDGADFSLAVKSAVVQAVCRALDAAESAGNVSSSSETFGMYSYTFNYANAGQSLYFLNNELKDLGLKRQKFGTLEVFGGDGDAGC